MLGTHRHHEVGRPCFAVDLADDLTTSSTKSFSQEYKQINSPKRNNIAVFEKFDFILVGFYISNIFKCGS